MHPCIWINVLDTRTILAYSTHVYLVQDVCVCVFLFLYVSLLPTLTCKPPPKLPPKPSTIPHDTSHYPPDWARNYQHLHKLQLIFYDVTWDRLGHAGRSVAIILECQSKISPECLKRFSPIQQLIKENWHPIYTQHLPYLDPCCSAMIDHVIRMASL